MFFNLLEYSYTDWNGCQVTFEAQPTRRQQQAAQTRDDIIDAARRLFFSQGYARTSVSQIASAAGVSVQTIYDSVGSKAEIVRQLNDLIDVEGQVPEYAARIPTATDGRELLDLTISIAHNISERCDDIISAVFSGASVEPELATVRDEGRRRHLEGNRRVAERLAEIGQLREGLDVDEAADMIAVLCDPQVLRTVVHDYGWTRDRWHTWALDTLATLVLRE